MVSLYNSLTKTEQTLDPSQKKQINLYSCGPTVYNFAHIGNLRSFIFADVLYRTLVANGFEVKWVMNITDVDDKTIKGTIEKYGTTATVADLKVYTDFYYQAFLEDLTKVGVDTRSIEFVKITDDVSIATIKTFVKKLLDLGFAYRADDGSTYFSIDRYQERFHDYGALMGEKFLEGKKVNARIANDEYQKDNLSDFALWKAHAPADSNIFWDDETLGKGRPGWHIECSAINWQAFGPASTTIHTGGIDLKFPHHTNEIAQSAPLYAPAPFTEHWFHSEHLLVDGKKMSKSAGNFYTLRDIEQKGFSGLAFRYFVLGAHYRTQQNFSLEALRSSQTALDRIHESAWHTKTYSEGKPIDQDQLQNFIDVANTDLSTSELLGNLHVYLKKELGRPTAKTLTEMDKILGLGIERGIESLSKTFTEVTSKAQELRAARDQARTDKNWAESDRLRLELEEQGYKVEDTKDGTKLTKRD